MSLKENIDYMKQEISAQESFMENFFKIEKFYNRYKKTIFSLVGVIIVAIIGYYISDYVNQQNRLSANIAFNKVLENPNDKDSMQILQEKNPKLHSIALFIQDKTAPTEIKFLKELSLYTQAMQEQNLEKLSLATQSQEFLLKDFALFHKALLEAQNNQFEQSKTTLKQIPESSNINSLVKMLEHFLLTK